MYDIERVTSMIKDIEKYKKELELLKIKSLKDLEDPRNFHAASMLCFSILNRVIDIGQEILVKESEKMPTRYAEIFFSLAEMGVMNEKEAKEISNMIDFRNIIAHTYSDITQKDVFRIINSIVIIDRFIDKIKKRIRKGE